MAIVSSVLVSVIKIAPLSFLVIEIHTEDDGRKYQYEWVKLTATEDEVVDYPALMLANRPIVQGIFNRELVERIISARFKSAHRKLELYLQANIGSVGLTANEIDALRARRFLGLSEN